MVLVWFGSVLLHYVLTNWALQLADVTSKSLRHAATDPLDRWPQQIAASETWFDLLKSWKKLELLETSGSLKSSTPHPRFHTSSQFARHLFSTLQRLSTWSTAFYEWTAWHLVKTTCTLPDPISRKQRLSKVWLFLKTPKLSCPLPYQDTLFQGPAKAFLRCFTWQFDKWLWQYPKLFQKKINQRRYLWQPKAQHHHGIDENRDTIIMKMRSLCRVASLEVFRFSLVPVVSMGWQLSARYFHAASHWWLPIA